VSGHDFPARFPIFPLPNLVLFPGIRLPLHIFEPRYRAMTRDALAGDRVIGMLLVRPGADAMQPRAPVFDVGVAGRITDCTRMPDGRYDLLLLGERRFRLLGDEVTPDGYRVADIELLDGSEPETAEQEHALREDRALLERLALEHAEAADPRSVELLRGRLRALTAVQLVHALAFAIDADPLEKQGVLEGRDSRERCRRLLSLLEFRKRAHGLPDPPSSVN
jgi:Lon protease-like protein